MQLSDFTFLFFSLPRQDANYTSTPWQLAYELTLRNTVLFADNPLTITEAVLSPFRKNVRKIIKGYFSKTWYHKNGVVVIVLPFVLPTNFLPPGKIYNFVSAVNQRIVAKRLNYVIDNFEIKKLIYVNSFNFYYPILWTFLKLKPSIAVYHCIDPMVKKYTLKHGIRLQDEAAKISDLIISTSPSLMRNFQKAGYPESIYIPNAANFSLFSNSHNLNKAVGVKLDSIKGKVMGYLGNIERRFDEVLILKVLAGLPEWSLILSGPLDRGYFHTEFLYHPRIFFIGPCTHSEAPAIVNRFDIAIIPFKVDDVSKGIYPLKLFEYLAAAKTVVTTNFNPEVLEPLREVIHIADNAEQFVRLVLQNEINNIEKINKRRLIAWSNSWEVRAQQFLTAIKHKLLKNE